MATDVVCGLAPSWVSSFLSADSALLPKPELGRLLLAGDDIALSPGPRDERFPSPTSVVIN